MRVDPSNRNFGNNLTADDYRRLGAIAFALIGAYVFFFKVLFF